MRRCARNRNCSSRSSPTLAESRSSRSLAASGALAACAAALGSDSVNGNFVTSPLDSAGLLLAHHLAPSATDRAFWARVSDFGLLYSQAIAAGSAFLVLIRRSDAITPTLYAATQSLTVGPGPLGIHYTAVSAFKAYFKRIRPPGAQLASYSFPSGHIAFSAICVFASIFILLPYALPEKTLDTDSALTASTTSERAASDDADMQFQQVTSCIALITPIALGRVISQNHFTSDALGGALLAGSSACILDAAQSYRIACCYRNG